MVSKGVPQRAHRFDPVDAYVPCPKTASLEKEVFEPSPKRCKLDLGELALSKPKPPYYTCSAPDLGRVVADVSMYADVADDKTRG